MSTSGEFGRVSNESSDDIVATHIEVERRDVPTVSHGGGRNPLALFPLILGVLILALDVYLLVKFSAYFFAENLQGAVSLALVFVSIIICLFLIAYASGLARFDRQVIDPSWHATSPYGRWVVVPLLLGAVAAGATIGGMAWNRSTAERLNPPKSCIDVYEQAQNIAKENPRFRMAEKDRDEARCAVNKSLGR